MSGIDSRFSSFALYKDAKMEPLETPLVLVKSSLVHALTIIQLINRGIAAGTLKNKDVRT